MTNEAIERAIDSMIFRAVVAGAKHGANAAIVRDCTEYARIVIGCVVNEKIEQVVEDAYFEARTRAHGVAL